MAEKVWLRFEEGQKPVEFTEDSCEEMNAFLRGVSAEIDGLVDCNPGSAFFQFDEQPFPCPLCKGKGERKIAGTETTAPYVAGCDRCDSVGYVNADGFQFS